DDAPDLGVRRAGQLGDRPGAVAAGMQAAHQLVTACPQRRQVGGGLRQLVAQLLLQLVAAGTRPRLSAGNYDYPLGGGADVSFNPGGDGGQLIIGGLSRQTELVTRVVITGGVPVGGPDLLHRRNRGIFTPTLDDLVDLPLSGQSVVTEHTDGITRTRVDLDVRAVQDPLGQRGDLPQQLVCRVGNERRDLPGAHLPQPHPARRAVTGPVVGVQRAVGQIQVDVDGLRLVVVLVPTVQRVRLHHGADLHSGHGGRLSPFLSLFFFVRRWRGWWRRSGRSGGAGRAATGRRCSRRSRSSARSPGRTVLPGAAP